MDPSGSPYMSYSLDDLKGGLLYRGVFSGIVQGFLRGILGVQPMAHIKPDKFVLIFHSFVLC